MGRRGMKWWLVFLVCIGGGFTWESDLGAWEVSWQIRRHGDSRQFQQQIANMTRQGYVPTGLSHVDGDIVVLYIKTKGLKIKGWRFASYQSKSLLGAGITSAMEEGYIPSGISYTGRLYFVMYIKKPHSATAWRLISSEATAGAVSASVEQYAQKGYFPVGITHFSGRYYTLLIKLDQTEIESWVIRTSRAEEKAIKEDVNHLIDAGFLPWGLLWRGRQVHVLYAGLTPYRMID